MKRSQAVSHGVTAAEHTIRSGDHPSAGGGVDLSEGD
jgi:type IV secretion system protein TrbL